MFFYASKVAWALIAPLDLIGLCCLAAFLLRPRLSRLSRGLLVFAALIFCALGVFPLGSDLTGRLENRYARPDSLPAHIDGILILGGAIDTQTSAARGFPIFSQHGQRLLEGLRLAQSHPEAKLVFTGGENSFTGHGVPEATFVGDFLKRYPVASPAIIYESRSRNTAENFAFTMNAIHPATGETWILVTSAFHMPRAMASAQAAGWPTMIPWPADYLTDGRWRWLPTDLNLTAHFYLADTALREYVGLMAYDFLQPEKHAQ